MPPVSSTGIEERVSLHGPICFPEEDPHIICSICNIVDFMIHNPRHRYCIDCGQRLMGPHICPNETEHSDPTRTQTSIMTRRTQPIPVDNGRTHFSGTFFVPHVRSNLTIHRSDTPFIIQQPICRPRLLERVYKPIRIPHWCRDLQSSL